MFHRRETKPTVTWPLGSASDKITTSSPSGKKSGKGVTLFAKLAVVLFLITVIYDNYYTPAAPAALHGHKPAVHKKQGVIDVLIVAGALNCALDMVLDGLSEFLTPTVRKFHIVLPFQMVGTCEGIYASSRLVNCVAQESLLPFTIVDVQHVLAEKGGNWATLGNRAGWYQQQLVKLFTSRTLSLTERFAMWDADNVLTAPFTLFDEENRITISTKDNESNIYSVTTSALLSFPTPRSDTVTYYMGVELKYLNQLLEVLCPKYSKDVKRCAFNILRNIPAEQPTTYTDTSAYFLYHSWLLQNAKDSVVLRSNIHQHRLKKTLRSGQDCSWTPEEKAKGSNAQATILDHYHAGTPRELPHDIPEGYGADSSRHNYMKAYFDTVKQPPCKNTKEFVEKIVTRWYCLDHIPKNNCTVYSFGIANQWEFDDFFHKEMGCTVYSYDPSNGKKKHQRGEKHFFDSIGIGAKDGQHEGQSTLYGSRKEYEVYTLDTLMKRNGDSFIDVLRIDTEGAEWEILGSFIEENIFDKVRYFSAELHMWDKVGFHEYFFHYIIGIPMKLLWQSRNTDPKNKETRKEMSAGVTRVYEVLWGH